MAKRQRKGPVKNLLKWAKQFSDPKFNPERRTAMQMLAAAPVAGKMKLTQGALSQLDPVQFYRGLLTKGLDIAPEWTLDPKLLREAFLNELPESNLHEVYSDWNVGGPMAKDDILSDSYSQAFEDWPDRFADNNYSVENFTPEQVAKLDAAKAEWSKGEFEDDYYNAMQEFIDSLDPMDVVSEHGGDDLFNDYYNAVRGENINNYINDEAARLGVEPDVLIKELGVEDFLKKAPQIGTASENAWEKGYVDITDVPEYYYQDPEALRYAKLRELLSHPKLTPSQMLEATYGDVNEALANIDADQIASNVYHDMLNYRLGYTGPRELGDLSLDRMHPDTRAKLVERFSGELPDEMQELRRKFSQQEPMLMQAEDLPSYISTSNPFRVRLDKANRMRKDVKEPLPYLDVIKALPPEEYSNGGRV